MPSRAVLPLAVVAAVLAAPATALANPAVRTDARALTNLNRLPATVVHRLTLTAGAADEEVRVSAPGDGLRLGGSAVLTAPA